VSNDATRWPLFQDVTKLVQGAILVTMPAETCPPGASKKSKGKQTHIEPMFRHGMKDCALNWYHHSTHNETVIRARVSCFVLYCCNQADTPDAADRAYVAPRGCTTHGAHTTSDTDRRPA
jgi:hypothetical protein